VETIKLWQATAEPLPAAAEPGTVLSADATGVRVACGEGQLCMTQLQRPGGKMLPAGEFLAGYPLVVGEVLPSAEMPAFVSDRPFPRAPKA
jgi:methionyl-tRNA formyltransferase